MTKAMPNVFLFPISSLAVLGQACWEAVFVFIEIREKKPLLKVQNESKFPEK